MLDMIPIIEEQKIIQPAIMTDCPTSVFIVSLQIAKRAADQKAREVNRQSKKRSKDDQRAPKRNHSGYIERQKLQGKPVTRTLPREMMSEMPRPPERLREAQQ